MPGTGIKEGIGITIGFSTSSLTLNLLDMAMDGVSVKDIDTSDQGTTGYRTYIASTLKEGGTFTAKVNWNAYDHAALAAAIGVSQTITITLPKVVSTDVTAPSFAFTGYLNSIAESGMIDQLQSGTIKFKVADDITFTDGSVA